MDDDVYLLAGNNLVPLSQAHIELAEAGKWARSRDDSATGDELAAIATDLERLLGRLRNPS